MERDSNTYNDLLSENKELKYQLEEANDAIQAIRSGQVDAFILEGDDGHQLYTLKTADQTYRVFIEKMNEGAVTLNRDGLVLYSNTRFAEMVKMPLEKVPGLMFHQFIAQAEREKFDKLVHSGWQDDCKEEISLLTTEQSTVCCLLSCNALDLDEGIALSLILTDLTMLKDAEQQLKQKNEELAAAKYATEKLNDDLEDLVKERTNELLISREHFRLLANNIPQMTWTSLPNGDFNFYNQQWYDYTGFKDLHEKEFVWRDVIHPDDLELTLDRYRESLNSGNVFEVENRYKSAAYGTYRWHLNRAVPLLNDDGEIILWLGTATDIEEQKQAMERKDEFIGIASHELKTPLTSLKGYLQLLASYKKEILPQMVKTYIDKANLSMNKLQHLVNDLLDVSKIQAGRLEYRMSPINLSVFVKDWVENVEHIYPNYRFESMVQTEGLLVNGNAERLEQVLMNLVNNAVKYSPENREIDIKTAKEGNNLRVSVTDRGIGLSAAQIERIFERFYRVEDKKLMAGGLGMGLYISAEIIQAHDGKIGVESVPGEGSTFYFEVPLINA